MKVWILQTGEPLQIDSSNYRPMRAINLSNMLIDHGHDVTIWSSNFDHFTKKHRFSVSKTINYSDQLQIRLIDSLGYDSHFGIRRIIDHIQLAINLRKMLRDEDPPDVAVLGYPPIEVSWIFAKWLTNRKVPFLVDVKDKWPDIFIKAFPLWSQRWIKPVFMPFQFMFKQILYQAGGILAPSKAFLDWCIENRGSKENIYDCVTPLTSPDSTSKWQDIKAAENWLETNEIYEGHNLRISFIGSLNHNYEFQTIINAVSQLPIELVIAGNGPELVILRDKYSTLPNVKFIGWIDLDQANALINRSHIMLLPYKKTEDFDMNITNKFYDAIRNSKPVLSSQGGVVRELIETHKIGINYESDKPLDLLTNLKILINDKEQLLMFGKNSRKLYLESFDFNSVYENLVRLLEALCSKK